MRFFELYQQAPFPPSLILCPSTRTPSGALPGETLRGAQAGRAGSRELPAVSGRDAILLLSAPVPV